MLDTVPAGKLALVGSHNWHSPMIIIIIFSQQWHCTNPMLRWKFITIIGNKSSQTPLPWLQLRPVQLDWSGQCCTHHNYLYGNAKFALICTFSMSISKYNFQKLYEILWVFWCYGNCQGKFYARDQNKHVTPNNFSIHPYFS